MSDTIRELFLREIMTVSIDREHSMYVSKRGKLETFGLTDALEGDDGDEDKVLRRLAGSMKEQFKKPVLVNTVDATHYGFVNHYFSF